MRAVRYNRPSDDTHFPFALPVLAHFDELPLHPAVTFLVGENGSGKSTLLEAIAVAWGFNPEGGSRNFTFSTRASHSSLAEHLTLVKNPVQARDGFFLRAESYFNLGTEIEQLDAGGGGRRIIDSYGGRSLHEQSHGESFLALLLHRFGGGGFYVLDEPEAALSPMRQLSTLARIHELVHAGSQFVIATHSPILMAYPEAIIYQIDGTGATPVEFAQTEHYAVTCQFLSDPSRMLAFLLDDPLGDAESDD